MQISIDYQSFYNLQVEMRNYKKKIISKVEVLGVSYQVDFLQYMESIKQLRLMVTDQLGETRIQNINPENFKITKFFIYEL